jgi:hypothetical protein
MSQSWRLLVGDNPFQGVSHFSQEKARQRDARVTDPGWAADIIRVSIESGASGFMFSVSENTLNILGKLSGAYDRLKYYAIVPAAADYVRFSSQVGMVGLARYVTKQTFASGNIAAITHGAWGLLSSDVVSLMKAYTSYELSRINRALKGEKLYSLMFHELITEMAVAMNMDWLLVSFVRYLKDIGIKPGFETRNFISLVNKLKKLEIDTDDIVITAPFNTLGFQMNPSRQECEMALAVLSGVEIIAMSVLGSGKVKPAEARAYLDTLPGLAGAVIGVSSKAQAQETFRVFRHKA